MARTLHTFPRRLTYLRARWPQPIGTKPPIGLAVCAIFRNESPYLAEWVTFHRLQGVERFYLYNNLSSDSWAAALEPEITSGLVTVTDWPKVPGQGAAYDDCLRLHRADTRWIAFLDIDEFLFSPSGRSLPSVLEEFDNFPGVVVNWRVYGANGWEHPPPGLVIDNYQLRVRDDHPSNTLVKSIVFPRAAVGVGENPAHYFRLRGLPVDEYKRPALHHTRIPPTTDLLRINHYYVRSAEQFRHKSARPRADFGTVTAMLTIPPDDQMVSDSAITQFAAGLRYAMNSRVPQQNLDGDQPHDPSN